MLKSGCCNLVELSKEGTFELISLISVLQVVSENWVVYHYFNLRQHRYEMSVLEIYDHSRLVWVPSMILLRDRPNG